MRRPGTLHPKLAPRGIGPRVGAPRPGRAPRPVPGVGPGLGPAGGPAGGPALGPALGAILRPGLPLALALVGALGLGSARAEPGWAVDPREPGPDLPPVGRSLFDRVVGARPVPFPFADLIRRIESELAPGGYLGRPVKQVLIPLGRSLQRHAAAPEPFRFPRAVVAVDGEPVERPGQGGLLLRDRLYLGYLEKAGVLEAISYNEDAGRFEYQVVRDYRADGVRQVAYAPRGLCLSCHQNGAPLFARPLWDETNANPLVRDRLEAQGRDFYGMPLNPGLDEAYAIDLATDRANGLALTQRLWSQGCGDGGDGAACRGALVLRAVQWGLSGGRGFDDRSADYQRTLRVPLAAHRDLQWPEGLKIPNPDIPNRRPLERGRPLPAGGAPGLAAVLFGDSDIPAPFEPLAPRGPLELWRPTDRALVGRAVAGLADFLARADLVRLDDRLAGLPAPRDPATADCALAATAAPGGGESLRLTCTDPALGLDARLTRRPDGSVSGRIPGLRVGGEDLGEVRLAADADAEPDAGADRDAGADPGGAPGALRLRPYRLGQETRLRLADGRRVAAVEVVPAGAERARVRVWIAADLAPLARVLDRLAAERAPALDAGPFRRAAVVDALLVGLGAPPLAWCCADDARLPPPRGPERSAPAGPPELEPFFRSCARCHRTPDPFPPNFLSGTPAQVAERVGQCAERIAYRLGMWALDPPARPKTPMPPHMALASRGIDPAEWASGGRLAELQGALGQVAAAQGRPLPAPSDLLARDYGALRPCLAPPPEPESHPSSRSGSVSALAFGAVSRPASTPVSLAAYAVHPGPIRPPPRTEMHP